MKKEHKKLERELEQLTDSIDWSEQASMEKQRERDVTSAQIKKLEEERPALVKKLNNPNR